MRKYTILMILTLSIMMLLSACDKPAEPLKPVMPETGEFTQEDTKTAKMMGRKGPVVEDRSWIYYCKYLPSYKRSSGVLYRVKKDGSCRTILCKDGMENFILAGDWIYFANIADDDTRIYKIKTDGSQKTRISKNRANFLNLYGDFLYYINETCGEYGELFRIKLDGSQESKLSMEECGKITPTDEGWIYYISKGFADEPGSFDRQKRLCRIKADGSKTEILADEIEHFTVAGEWVYCSTNKSFYKIRTDGSDKVSLGEFSAEEIIVENEWIYYINCSDQCCLYRMKLDGSKNTKINNGYIDYCVIIGDYLYCSDSGQIYKMRKNGDEKKTILTEQDNFINNIYVIDEWIYYYQTLNEYEKILYKVRTDGTEVTGANNGQWKDKFPIMITSSSTLQEKNRDYKVQNIMDRDWDTAWVEGVPGNGIGEWLEIVNLGSNNRGMKQTLSGMFIINGYVQNENGDGQSRRLYEANNRVKRIGISFSDGSYIERELQDHKSFYQEIEFDREVETTSVKIKILEVYPGSKYDDTCISEIELY